MQIKKIDWINKPEKVRVSAHSLSFKAERRCAALYTLEEEGKLALIRHNSETVSFLMLHTKNDRIIFRKDHADMKFSSLSEWIYLSIPDEIRVRKEGKKIVFSSATSALLTLENDAFFSSASFGFLIEKSDEEIKVELY